MINQEHAMFIPSMFDYLSEATPELAQQLREVWAGTIGREADRISAQPVMLKLLQMNKVHKAHLRDSNIFKGTETIDIPKITTFDLKETNTDKLVKLVNDSQLMVDSAKSAVIKLIQDHKGITLGDLIANTVKVGKQTQKITRLLNSKYTDFLKFYELSDLLSTEFSKFQASILSFKDTVTEEQTQLKLSIDLGHFLVSSANPSFNSCHSANGCRNKAYLHLGADYCTAVAFIPMKNKNFPSYRALVYIDVVQKKFRIGRIYGGTQWSGRPSSQLRDANRLIIKTYLTSLGYTYSATHFRILDNAYAYNDMRMPSVDQFSLEIAFFKPQNKPTVLNTVCAAPTIEHWGAHRIVTGKGLGVLE